MDWLVDYLSRVFERLALWLEEKDRESTND